MLAVSLRDKRFVLMLLVVAVLEALASKELIIKLIVFLVLAPLSVVVLLLLGGVEE